MSKTKTSTKQNARNKTKTAPVVDAIDGQGNPEPTEQATMPEQVATEPKPAKAPKVLPTLDEALATAKATGRKEYAHVVSVVELSKDGEPKRVVIACQDPQTKQVNGTDVSVCQGEREIAVQDLFQVQCCAACADRKVRKARRDRAKRKNKALRAAIKAAKPA